MLDRGDQPLGLVLGLAKLRMWSRQHHLERRGLIVTEIEASVRTDVGLDSVQQAKGAAHHGVDVRDRPALLGRLLHGHATRDLQPV